MSFVRAHVCNWLQLEGEPAPDRLSVQTRAAEKLGVSERVLRYKLKKYRIKEQ